MTILSYFGTKPCCDCGRTGNFTVNKNGYQFTVCADCVQNYSEEEQEEADNDR
jgi:ribosome-binding protein aMBF1 (putative translation factor)